jgi:hypothetical protein
MTRGWPTERTACPASRAAMSDDEELGEEQRRSSMVQTA